MQEKQRLESKRKWCHGKVVCFLGCRKLWYLSEMSETRPIPRHIDVEGFRSNPLIFLQSLAKRGEPLVLISDSCAIFSRSSNCRNVVAAFGPEALRGILTNADAFGMAVSAAEQLALPPALKQLNQGLFSMTGETHTQTQHLLRPMFSAQNIQVLRPVIEAGWKAFHEGLQTEGDVALLAEMRQLVMHVSGRVVFGLDHGEIAREIQNYFDMRRQLASDPHRAVGESRRSLLRMGNRVRRAILGRLDSPSAAFGGLIDHLRLLKTSDGKPLAPDDVVSHANVLFMSSSEPVVVALTWILIILSQLPQLRSELRRQYLAVKDEWAAKGADPTFPLLDGVIFESLRLLPPNAIMVRLTKRPVELCGHHLDQDWEVLFSPFVEHRNPNVFSDPESFRPDRWLALAPTQFTYFPFGTGTRYCLGKPMALMLLRELLVRLVVDFDIVLSKSQMIDWKMDVVLRPQNDPTVKFQPVGSANERFAFGRLDGPSAELFNF
ncbi:RiPP biosynthesis cytochrome P450 ApyO [Rhizobium ruizarguesonis]|uniref:RiPP biosynthesis cytochrome P450 ApyO n=1 Tax=Rhizobium ruizarguesonis TaxID=2081791 RepID=UPI00102FB90D|nr:cytochrome P450 [Rhizobium ruizarguesonis]TAY81980.1 cytochrome P450 [Rhizobium ruizarguesonis]